LLERLRRRSRDHWPVRLVRLVRRCRLSMAKWKSPLVAKKSPHLA
jgi:hypothetical protein